MHYVGQGYTHPELIDPETEENLSWKKGVKGELVYTPLAREATPLLRFQSGDYAKIVATECACERTSPRIQVIGRTDNMLIYKGMNVFPSALREVIADIDGTTPRVRVVVPDENTVQFQDPIPIIVGRDPDSEYSEDEIVENIVETVRAKLQVRIQPMMIDAKSDELAKYKTKLVITDDEMNELINQPGD
jgi:phenylacetate-CoA ligase/benzoylacetate-CoA ligase